MGMGETTGKGLPYISLVDPGGRAQDKSCSPGREHEASVMDLVRSPPVLMLESTTIKF